MEGISAPPPCRIGETKEWITSDDPALGGFSVLVRTSITNAERAELRKRDDFITGEYTDQWNATPPEERDMEESPRVLQRKMLATHIYGWNAHGRTADGEWKPIPPPAETGYEAFDCILRPQFDFIFDVVLSGYYHLGKAESWRKILAATGVTSEAKPPDADLPQPEPTPIRPKRRRNSSTPSASISTA